MSDVQFEQCIDCPNQFEMTQQEKDWFLQKGLTPPRRCKPCRAKKKAERAQHERSAR